MTHEYSASRRALLLGGCAVAVAHRSMGGATAATPRIARQFDSERFIEDCRAAVASGADAQAHIKELLARELGDRNAVVAGLGPPTKGGLKALHRSPELTILNIVWSPLMQLLPHDHNMWALIGIYTGREDNIFWRRDGLRLSASGAVAISAGDVIPMPSNVIHSVNNPIEKLSGAIHVYGGDFFAVHRSEWDPETLAERDWSIAEAVRNFERANARFAGSCAR
jgi:predicted metal-dependent enzyme (double-stranded beta helix superfamily)